MHDEQATPQRRVIRRYSAEDRKRLIDEFRNSGLTAQAFCKQVGIHPTTLSGWMRRAAAASTGFAEVTVSMPTAAPIEVDLPNGVRIRVRTTGDVSRTAELIRAVAAPLGGGSGC
jgi:transposase-like protein